MSVLRYSLGLMLVLLILGGAYCLSYVWAQETSGTALSGDERYQANLRRWQSMTEEERQAIRNRAAGMSEEDRAALKEKVKEYRAMPEQDRQSLRENFQRFQALPPARRAALEEGSRGFRQLPPPKREEIRRRFQKEHKVQGDQDRGPGAPSRGPGGRPDRVMQMNGDDHPPRPQGGPGDNLNDRPGRQGRPDVGPGGNNGNNLRGPRPGPQGSQRKCDDPTHPCLTDGPMGSAQQGGADQRPNPHQRPGAQGGQNRSPQSRNSSAPRP